MTSIFLSFLFLFATAQAEPAHSVAGDSATLNQEFEVRLGRQVSIRREGLTITFIALLEDSRCPQGVECIQAGNGRIALKITKAGRRPAVLRLNTSLEPKEDAYRGYEVKLVNLNPYPKKDVRIRRRDYVATLVISRR